MRHIDFKDLVNLSECSEASESFRVHLDYAGHNNILFGERIYKTDAQLWLYKDLADIVILAARMCLETYGHRFIVHDGLRTVEAQARMLETDRVKQNPHWLQEPRLLSPPGAGGHPRGMAVDISLETYDGKPIDMGTPFDFLAEDSSPQHNPAHRDHPYLSLDVQKNREVLNTCMQAASEKRGMPLVFLPQEWWDFRMPKDVYEQYSPLSDKDLPPFMQMMD